MNKKGMTLLELLVYMALAALLLAPVIMLMNTSSKNMARDASNTELRVSGRDLLNIIYDDLKNTGFKLNNFVVDDNATYVGLEPIVCADVDECDSSAINPTKLFDRSSFMSHDGGPGAPDRYYDSLTVKMARLNEDGSWKNKIDTICYYVEDKSGEKKLVRYDVNSAKRQVLARNVAALQFQYSDNLIDWDDHYETNDPADRYYKRLVQYIKVILVLKDDKRLAATNNQKITVIDYKDQDVPNLVITEPSQALYERHEIVVPIPNNGLWP